VASEPFPFPVGDDPNDPDVLEYWMSVARRLDGLLLPRDLKGWREFIAERVSEYRVAAAAVAVEADRMRDDDTALIAARRRRSAAHSEFERIKPKLERHFISAFDRDDPALVALFARSSGRENGVGGALLAPCIGIRRLSRATHVGRLSRATHVGRAARPSCAIGLRRRAAGCLGFRLGPCACVALQGPASRHRMGWANGPEPHYADRPRIRGGTLC
jgi:hypothetical protein